MPQSAGKCGVPTLKVLVLVIIVDGYRLPLLVSRVRPGRRNRSLNYIGFLWLAYTGYVDAVTGAGTSAWTVVVVFSTIAARSGPVTKALVVS